MYDGIGRSALGCPRCIPQPKRHKRSPTSSRKHNFAIGSQRSALKTGEMFSTGSETRSERPGPPPPPPMPPPPKVPRQPSIKLSTKASPFIQKLQAAPPGYFFESTVQLPPTAPFSPACGPYFFYGSLMDATLLSEILSLSAVPTLRPARVIGYAVKLWGQYPALVDGEAGEAGEAVEGMLYDVAEVRHAERLAEYETRAYGPAPCLIYVREGDGEREIGGTTFKYVGNPMDIKEGTFDLDSWLSSIGRATAGSATKTEDASGGAAGMVQEMRRVQYDTGLRRVPDLPA